MAAFVVMACVWALLLWVQIVKYLPQQRAIVGCRHTKGRIQASVPDRMGRMTALVWHCRDCPFQLPLRVQRVPGKVPLWMSLDDVIETVTEDECPG